MGDIFGIAIVRPFGLLLRAIYEIVQNYGVAMILFALLVKLVMIPLAIKNKKSMVAMSSVQKELQGLQKKYANNREKLNEETMKLYSKYNISPTAGCLPMVIQLPIMMALYYAVQQPLKYIIGLSQDSIGMLAAKVGIDLTTAGYTAQIKIAEALNAFVSNGHFSDEITSLATDIQQYLIPLNFNFMGLNIAETPSISHPSVLWVIPILSGATALLSSVIMQKMQGNNAAQGSMKTMLYIMPLMSVYFAFILPGAIGIYWVFNNVFTCVQEIFMNKFYGKKRLEEEQARKNEEQRAKAEKQAKMEANRQAQIENSRKEGK